jgi:protein-S-isoprenylcysteine O-methyltransferase Ste14
MAAVLFLPAGSLRFWQAWLCAFVFISSSGAIGVYFSKHDPRLIERRMKAAPHAENESSQKLIICLLMGSFVVLLAFPGLDYRWHWPHVPVWLTTAANVGVALSFVLFFAVLKQNSYAASTVTVEVDQPVVSTGLYGLVRHPMYAGALLLILVTPLALGSYWGLLASAAALLALIWRLLHEQRILRRDLQGYANYRMQVRYRLVPGIW